MARAKRILLALAATAICAWLGLTPQAGATGTIGSPMTAPPATGFLNCLCTRSQAVLPGAKVASPVNGMVVRWRVDWSGPDSARLRIIRPLGASDLFLAAGETQPVVGGANEFATSLPISIGDRIGVDSLLATGSARGFTTTTGASMQTWTPPPANGAAPPPTSTDPDFELYLNADVEPTSSLSLSPVSTDKKNGTAALTATVPNPGSISFAGGPVKPGVVPVTQPGTVPVILAPTKQVRKRLREKGHAKGQISVSYTPLFGAATTQAVEVKLKRKRPKH